jgi:uncharacterized protein YndB with AHSA1/START domain
MTASVVMQVDLPQPPETVWRALTDPELVAKWLMKTDLKPVVGAAFTFRIEASPAWDGVVQCEMLELEPHTRIRYAWRALGVDTIVTWTLARTASGGTRLGLEQSGFKPEHRHASAGAKHAWTKKLATLAELLAATTHES